MTTTRASVGASNRPGARLESLHLQGADRGNTVDLSATVAALGGVGSLAVVVDGQATTGGLDLGHLVRPGGIAVPASVCQPLNHFIFFKKREK